MAENSIKFQIKSDGSISGTTLIVNGENLTESENVTDIMFYATGGLKFSDGDETAPRLNLSYTTVDRDAEGSTVRKYFQYNPTAGFWVEEKPIGKPEEEEDSISDGYVGKKWSLIEDIDSYRDKTKRFIPSNAELQVRTKDSLEDLKKELEDECK